MSQATQGFVSKKNNARHEEQGSPGGEGGSTKAQTNQGSSAASSIKASPNFRHLPSVKRQRTVSFESQFEKIFMDAENYNEILQLFAKKNLTFAEKKHIDAVVQDFLLREFPDSKVKSDQTPMLRDLIHIGKSRQDGHQPKYLPGEWVEVLGHDMKWRLRLITRVMKQMPSNYNWMSEMDGPLVDDKQSWDYYTYHAGAEKNLHEQKLRAPLEGLQALFGLRPWVWQQWAMLKLEEKMRFQENHQDDFMILSAQRVAMQLWNDWIEHPSNQDFKALFYNDNVGDFGRSELLDHIFHPFVLIDQLTSGDDEWNLQTDQDVSVYTYQSLLGAYFHVSLVVFIIQVTIPVVLVFDVTKTFVECSQYQAYVPQNELIRVTLLIILTFYSMTLVPSTF